jgi:hypothetical protein
MREIVRTISNLVPMSLTILYLFEMILAKESIQGKRASGGSSASILSEDTNLQLKSFPSRVIRTWVLA